MTDTDRPFVTATLVLIGGPFENIFKAEVSFSDEEVYRMGYSSSLALAEHFVRDQVLRDYIRQRVPGARVLKEDSRMPRAPGLKGFAIDDGAARWFYLMTAEAQRGADAGVYPYTFFNSEPSSPYYMFDRRNWSEWPLPRVPLGEAAYQCEEIPLAGVPGSQWEGQASTPLADIRAARETIRNLADPRLRSGDTVEMGALPAGQVHPLWEWVMAGPEVPTTYCFDCGQMVPVADTWTKKNDPNVALCEGCFRAAEGAGRAKEGSQP